MTNERNVSWPGWEVVRTIGHGSFGAVYEIQRNTFGHIESAALKVITIPDKASDIEDLYNDGYTVEDVTMRFQGYLEDIIREYSLMVDMKGHSNVVYCDDFRYVQHEDGIGWDIYIKMELLTPLTKALSKEIDERQVMDLGIDICSALVMCRERNIVHRDIKPQNIFVSKDGTYKLGDFGIAKTAERTTSGTKIGTYKYMAPEVYNNQPYGAGADIYSLGLLMYWMLNERRTPFLPLPPQVPSSSMEDEARKRRFLGEEIPAPVHGSEELKAIVLKACAYDPKERFASAADMRDALLRLRDGAAVVIGAGVAAAAAAGDATEKGAQSDGMQEILEIVCSDAGTGAVIFSASADETGGTPESADAPEGHTAPESDTAPEVTVEEEKTTDHSAEKAEPKKRKPILWIVLAALLALCVGVGAFAVLRGDTGISVDAGGYHTVTLREDGTVAAVGRNDNSQCKVSGWQDIVAVSAGAYHTVGLKKDGTVVAAGLKENGQCDVSDWADIVAISAGDFHTVGLKKDGTVMAIGSNRYGQCDVSRWSDVVAISASWKHTAGLKADGTVVAVGWTQDGQCDVSRWSDIVAISTGEDYTVGLKSDGTVVATGHNDDCQCGISEWKDIVAISAGGYHTVGLKKDGTVVAIGLNEYGQCDVSEWTDIVAISAGWDHTVGLKSNGTVVAVGDNTSGQCDLDKLN